MPPSIRRVLNDLPESLDETYERILREIQKPNQRHAHRLLQCLVAAVRPLSLYELSEVLIFDYDAVDAEGIPEGPELNPDWCLPRKDKEEAIMTVCSNLFTIVKDEHRRLVVQFSHFSVKEFLTSKRLAEPIRDVSRYHIRLEDAHTFLVRVCLGALFRLRFNGSLVDDSPLDLYAVDNWFIHAQFGDVSSCVKDAIIRLFDKDKPHFHTWLKLADEPYCEDAPLFFVASFGFCDAAEHLIAQHPEQINAKYSWGQTPLYSAVAKGYIDMVSLLLKNGADVEARVMGQTPLHQAVMNGKLEVTRRLLDHGADINSRTERNVTPLCAAVARGHVELARMLLERGAAMDIRPRMDPGPTLLTVAVESRNIQMVRLLLEYGEDVNEPDGLKMTPSQRASKSQQQDIVELLLEYGAEPVQ